MSSFNEYTLEACHGPSCISEFRRHLRDAYQVAFAPVVLATESSPRTFELQDIIALALERNPILVGAEGAVQQSQDQRIEAGAYPNPTIAAQTSGGTIRDPSTGASLNEYLLTLSQSLEWTGKRSSRRREAEAGLAGTSIGVEEARLNLTADVKMLFYDPLLAEQQAQIATQNLSTVQNVARVVRARVMSGEGP